MKYLFLDIETVPLKVENEHVREYLMDKQISKEMRSFDPKYSKIICIVVKFMDGEGKVFSNEDEKTLLEDFWSYLRENFRNATLVTHNGYKFDVPFLVVRSCLNNVDIPIDINRNRWQMEKSNHFDIMMFFSQYENFTNPNLEMFGKMHGINVEGERFFGADIEKLYNKGEINKIKEKCRQDVEILEKVFKKLCLNYVNKIRV
jgi:predicted PolB exonuclease-like 3'-5' exonuclease